MPPLQQQEKCQPWVTVKGPLSRKKGLEGEAKGVMGNDNPNENSAYTGTWNHRWHSKTVSRKSTGYQEGYCELQAPARWGKGTASLGQNQPIKSLPILLTSLSYPHMILGGTRN